MKKSDRVLIGILVGIALIVLAGFVIALRWTEPDYRTGPAPEDIAYNYMLAIQKEDYAKAYSYLYPYGTNYPDTLSEFKKAGWTPYSSPSGSIQIESVEKSTLVTTVVIRVVNSAGGSFFNTDYSSSDYKIELKSQGSQWKISDFNTCWDC
jgi:hypothetical protein